MPPPLQWCWCLPGTSPARCVAGFADNGLCATPWVEDGEQDAVDSCVVQGWRLASSFQAKAVASAQPLAKVATGGH